MRWLLVLVLAGCGSRVHLDPMPIEQDDPVAGTPVSAPEPSETRSPKPEARSPAKPGIGARTLTIGRAKLTSTIDAGPGAFLHGFEVAAVMSGEKFAGWRLVRVMDGEHRFDGIDLAPGDVLLDVNGMPVAQPDQLAAVFESLRGANQIAIDLVRGGAPFKITIAVTP